MINFYLLLAIVFVTVITLCYHFRDRIRKYLHSLNFKLQMGTLRTAIHDADADKKKTDRKNMVVFNSASNSFEPIQKRLMKHVAKSNKNTNNAALTKGRIRMARKKNRKPSITLDRVKEVEKNSLYVTQ